MRENEDVDFVAQKIMYYMSIVFIGAKSMHASKDSYIVACPSYIHSFSLKKHETDAQQTINKMSTNQSSHLNKYSSLGTKL